MIIQENLPGNLIKTYSDAGMLIMQQPTGVLYAEAVDVANTPYTYTETDMPVEEEPEPEDLDEAARFLLSQRLVELPAQEQPDYLNERESEPDYFHEGD